MSAADDRQWFYSTSGEQLGPVSPTELQRLLASGAILPHHHVRHRGWDRWWTLREAAPTIGLDLGLPGSAVQPAPGVQPAGGVRAALPPTVRDGGHWATPGVQPASSGSASDQRPSATPLSPASAAGVGVDAVDFQRRAMSWAVDGVVLVGALFAFDAMFSSAAVWSTVFLIGFYVAYTFGSRFYGYDTLGHLAFGLSVHDIESGERPDWFRLAVRSAVVALLAVPLLLGLIASGLCSYAHPRSLAWHDLVSGTVVMKGSS